MNKSVMCGVIVAGFTAFSAIGTANADCHADLKYVDTQIENAVFLDTRTGKQVENSKDEMNMHSKLSVATAKYEEQKYTDSAEKLLDISDKAIALADAPKPKLLDATKITQAVDEAIDCVLPK